MCIRDRLYSGQQFYACILDEAQAIKNHTTQKYKAVCGVNSKDVYKRQAKRRAF